MKMIVSNFTAAAATPHLEFLCAMIIHFVAMHLREPQRLILEYRVSIGKSRDQDHHHHTFSIRDYRNQNHHHPLHELEICGFNLISVPINEPLWLP